MDLGIAGRRALVCASSKGLGYACASSLARAGVHVVLSGRDEASLEAAMNSLQALGASVEAVACDLTTAAGRKLLAEACPAPDILVTNNGGPPVRDHRAVGRPELLEAIEMNMIAPIEIMQAALPGMEAKGFGRIVHITSVAVRRPVAGLEVSSASRSGLAAFSAAIARDYASQNITMNCLEPGFFATDRLLALARGQATGNSDEQAQSPYASQVPAARLGRPEEFGDFCAFLCSAQAGYITGQNILMDGGLHASLR